jgi:chemotaxis protein CheD
VEQIVVGMADCRIATVPGQVLATFALGSCIGLAVYDSKARVGGLLHYMLPDSTIDSTRGKENPFMFADTGIPLLVQQVCAQGANKRNLIAHASGGASIMDPENVFDIGKRNYLALRKLLWKAGVLLTGEAVGGAFSRTVRLEIGSGNLWLQEGAGPRALVAGFAQRGGAARVPAASPAHTAPRQNVPVILAHRGGGYGLPDIDRR